MSRPGIALQEAAIAPEAVTTVEQATAAASNESLATIYASAIAEFEASISGCLFPNTLNLYLAYANLTIEALPLLGGQTLPQEVLASAAGTSMLVRRDRWHIGVHACNRCVCRSCCAPTQYAWASACQPPAGWDPMASRCTSWCAPRQHKKKRCVLLLLCRHPSATSLMSSWDRQSLCACSQM